MLKYFMVLLFSYSFICLALAQQRYEVIDLGTLSGVMAEANGINSSTQVVGHAFLDFYWHAFIWENGIMTDLGTLGLGEESSFAFDINNFAQVVGYSFLMPGNSSQHAVIWENGAITDLGTLGGSSSDGLGINDLTQVVGVSDLPGDDVAHAFLWENGVMTDLGTLGGESSWGFDINNSGQVVGRSEPQVGFTFHAFFWENGIMTDLGSLGGETAIAYGINESGQVVGESYLPSGNSHAFIWENGVMTELGTLGEFNNSVANSINNLGQVVGSSTVSSSSYPHAMIWENGVIADLNSLINPGSGWILTDATSINERGEIVGRGPYNGQFHAFLLTAGLEITRPNAGEKWIAGETDTIRWTGGHAGQIFGIDYSTDNGITYSDISFGAPADSGYFIWNIPKTILTTKAKIKLTDITDPNIKAVSDSFKIKPYIITKLDANGDYVAYNINTDRWGFRNSAADVWPRSWFQQFNYRGIDPFTNQQYPQQGFITFKVAPDSIHPDWVSWVNTFGVSACYFNVSIPIYTLNAIL